MKIITHQKRIPWTWVSFMAFPWVGSLYAEFCSGAPLTFTLRKFIEDPLFISFLSSINIAFNFMVGAVSSFVSDRIWTRMGRRRPFLITGWTLGALTLILIPLVNSLPLLVVLIVVHQFSRDLACPYEPLFNEVIPPEQRGRAATIRNISTQAMALVFFSVLLGKFDKKYDLTALGKSFAISGEQIIYWTGALMLLLVVALLAFLVKETPPPHGFPERKHTGTIGAAKNFVVEIFGSKHAWMIYLIYICPALMGAGSGALMPLMQNEQLGLTKQEMGFAGAFGIPFNMLLFIPLAGFLADRMSRLRMFQIGLLVPMLVNVAYYIYVTRFAGYHMTMWTQIGFGMTGAFFGAMLSVAWGPLIYDYIPSNRMGTVSAGFSFISGVIGFVMTNLSGWWVRQYTEWFGTAGGSKYDYTSMYLLMFTFGTIAIGLTCFFDFQVRRGAVKPLGRLELDMNGKPKTAG